MPLLAAGLPSHGEVVFLFALSAFIAYLRTRIRLVPIAGFLLTGVVVNDQEAALRTTHVARHKTPTLYLVARSRFSANSDRFRKA